MVTILIREGFTPDIWGFIPYWLDTEDPRPAAKQLDEHYQHGGGWTPQEGFTFDKKTKAVSYPGDPPFQPIAIMRFRDETIIAYQYSYFLILQKDGSFEICRMD
jgi:hypothetical protein